MNGELPGMPDDSLILDHAESPYHRGRVANATCAHAERNPVCGDWVRLQLVIASQGRIDQAWFQAQGCLISRAAASILCQTIEGKGVRELRDFSAKRMLDLLQVRLTPGRLPCGLLAFRVLKGMIYSLDPANSNSR